MTDMEVMRATHATAKLGISFEGWDHPGSRCLHPFGLFGQDYGGIGFHHLWLDARARGDETPLNAYSLGAGLADHGRMALPQPNPPRSEEHTSELQSLMRTPYAVFCLKKNNK